MKFEERKVCKGSSILAHSVRRIHLRIILQGAVTKRKVKLILHRQAGKETHDF
jgi:hypothetical protein